MSSPARLTAADHSSAEWGKRVSNADPLPHTPIPAHACRILFVGLVQNTGLVI